MGRKKPKICIGRTEWVDFPKFDLHRINAKIDTGAYSTAVHCHRLWVEEDVLYFELLDPSHPQYNGQVFKSETFERKKVRSSNGKKEKRFLIKSQMSLGGKTSKVSITLTDRTKMRSPVLIGRKFLRKGYLIDVSKTYIHQPNAMVNDASILLEQETN